MKTYLDDIKEEILKELEDLREDTTKRCERHELPEEECNKCQKLIEKLLEVLKELW